MSATAPLQKTAVKPKQSSYLGHGGLLVQRQCACGSLTSSLTGESGECKSKTGLQAKLAIGASSDPLEQEADRVADQVLAAPLSSEVSGTPPRIQRYTGQSTGQTDTAPASVGRVLASPGRPLEPTLRQDMEQRFGHDFSRVRVHSGGAAEQSARDVIANAYTVGHNIVFGAGRFSPDNHEGRRLIAHELTHVVQQSRNRQSLLESNRVLQPSLMREEIADDEANRPVEEPGGEKETTEEVDDTDSDVQFAAQTPGQLTSNQREKSTKKKRQKPTPRAEERIPTATTASANALKALEEAKKLHSQNDPAIWFDSWGNDLRDNNLSGSIDDKAEQGIADGAHHGKVFDAKICSSPSSTTDQCTPSNQSMIKVQYKVCIDIPIESYKATGVNVSTSRWIPTFFSELSKKPNWTVWKKPSRPSRLLDGDIVAAANPDHQHAGIVDTGIIDSVINLPGPTSSRKFHLFNPSGTNDMVSVPRLLFESFLSIDWIARLNK